MKKLLTVLLMLPTLSAACAAAPSENPGRSGITVCAAQSDTTRHGRSLIQRITDYFLTANKDTSFRRFSFSVIGGPHYNTDTRLGLGLAGTGLYRTDSTDMTLQPSNVSLLGDVSTAGYYMAGISGLHITPHDRYRIDYSLKLESFRTKYWGMGFADGDCDTNESKMTTRRVSARVAFLWRLTRNLYLGPMAAYDFNDARRIQRPDLLYGMPRHTINFGTGFALAYDSRNVITNPSRGAYISLTQCFRPRFMGNSYAFTTTDVSASVYRRVWRGGILAAGAVVRFNFGNPPWGMMSRLGSSGYMRGYYEGRYRDKHKTEFQAELRQHVWRRNGIVLWAGAGTVFSRFSQIEMRRLLPNAGMGYRWEFKKNVNVRLDYGIGKGGQSGFIFNIGEAF